MSKQSTSIIKRWDQSIVSAEIEKLRSYLRTLPAEHVGQWYSQRVHKEIRAQIRVLQTGKLEVEYLGDDIADAAFFALQWLYVEIEGLFSDTELRADEGPSQEWKMLAAQLGAVKV